MSMRSLGVNSLAGGGASAYRTLDLNVTGQVIKASQGRLYGYHLINSAATPRYVKLYNKATAPTQADTPVVTIALAATSSTTFVPPAGVGFFAGISARASNALADNDTTAPTAGDVVANFFFA
jgi:hypothetical protein